jgi:hypothetical protein
MRGEPRSVRFDDPGVGSSRLPRFAQPRCLRERLTIAGLPRRCVVRIDVHGSKDRVKDASRSACDGVPCLRPVSALLCVDRRRSPPWLPSDIRCHRRVRLPRRKPLQTITSRPRSSFRRHPAKSAAIRRTGMPSAATTRRGNFARRLLSPASAPALSLTPPTLFPQAGESALLGLASVTVRSPAIRDGPTRRWFESADTFFTPLVAPGTDDPSALVSSPDSAVDGS